MKNLSDTEIKINEGVIDTLLRFHNEVTKMSRNPNDYGTGYPVYQSEIHMIDFIGRHPDLNISELSELMGMTKSAVSQIITKLSSKKFIVKKRYRKEVTVCLTDVGKKLFNGHRDYHETLNQYNVFKNVEKYPLEFRALIAEFLTDYIADLPKY